jgi:hypothetical protein
MHLIHDGEKKGRKRPAEAPRIATAHDCIALHRNADAQYVL